MAEDELDRLVRRLDELEQKSNAEISDLRIAQETSELKLGQLEQHVTQSQEERTSLIGSNSNRSQATRGDMWHVIGDKQIDETPSNAFKQQQFTLPDDLCSVFCATSWKSLPFWITVLVIAGLQLTLFVLLLIDRVGSNRWIGVGGECDVNESILCRHERPLDMPPNVEPLVRAAQALCLIIALYDQDDIRDGLEGFYAGMPVDYKGSTNFRKMTRSRWNLSCFFRFLQGFLGVLCAFVLLVQADTVFDVLLNFLGVKFISGQLPPSRLCFLCFVHLPHRTSYYPPALRTAEMDEAAFHIAIKGYFGVSMQEAAEDVASSYFRREEDTRPWIPRNFHVIVMLGMLATMVAWFAHLATLQASGTYLVQHFHVDFGKDPLLSVFNGCYTADGLINKRLSYSQVGSEVKFGFCKKADKSENGGWTLYFGSSPCPSDDESEVLAVSEPTKSFDLPLVDPTKWYTPDKYKAYTPIEVVRFYDYFAECDDSSSDTPEESHFFYQCIAFNVTLQNRQKTSDFQKTFEILITEPSEEYPCRDPTTCRPIYVSKSDADGYSGDIDIIYFNGHFWAYSVAPWGLNIEYSGDGVTKDDIRNFFYKGDGFKIESLSDHGGTALYVAVVDGWYQSPLDLIWYEAEDQYISYSKNEFETIKYSIPYANLEKKVDFNFECVGGYTIPDTTCFEYDAWFSDVVCLCNEPIPDAFDLSTSRGMAFQDIKNDRRAIEMCAELAADDSLVLKGLIQERYALAVVKNTFGIESQGWDGNSCTSWLGDTVELKCDNQTSVQQLIFLDSDTVKHYGTIPPEIRFLSNLEHLDLGQNDILGEIPWELGFLGALTYLDLFDCSLTGSIPYDLGSLSNLKSLYLSKNNLTGQIPNFGNLKNLEVLSMYSNSLTGTIPAEMEANLNLTCFAQGNSITGTSKVCQL
ncbi:unnamed protein product [Cylindrotheca closterium]|uniref:Uncharacterized protein n=1 Tax=Cylindrotheca closterium TaxID=2856 RepID=A0AAD2CEN9_9STRA|nr:unnamed protein product [Cylindrotheca closterium]